MTGMSEKSPPAANHARRSTTCPSRSSSSCSRTAVAPTPRSARRSASPRPPCASGSSASPRPASCRSSPSPTRSSSASAGRRWSGSASTADIQPVADALAAIEEVIYVVMTAGTYDVLCEVVSTDDEELLDLVAGPHPRGARRTHHRDVRLPQARQADLLVGRALSVPTTSARTTARCRCGTTPPTTTSPRVPPCPARDVRRRDRRRRADRALDGLLPAAGPTRRLRIVVLEQEVAGFGASGRNGGWCSALFPTSWDAAGRATRRPDGALRHAPGDAGDGARGGPGRRGRGDRRGLPARRHRHAGPHPPCSSTGCGTTVATAHARGFTEEDERLLDADEASRPARRQRRPGRLLHPALRGGPPLPAGPRAGPGRRGERRADLRADPGAAPSSPGRVRDRRRHRPRRGRAARDRGLHRPARRAAARPWRRSTR